jgi:hypothetical protein
MPSADEPLNLLCCYWTEISDVGLVGAHIPHKFRNIEYKKFDRIALAAAKPYETRCAFVT